VLSVVILFAVNSMLTLRAWAERTSGVDLFFTLGMTADEIRRMEYSELAWRYSLPVLLATVNALFALQILWQVIDYQNSLALFLLVLGGIALVSWVFFILSAQMVRRSVTPR
jgi:1,4-dihydroxy-2-naphthoate octaprenyltransferase